jgi:hypothetical protein
MVQELQAQYSFTMQLIHRDVHVNLEFTFKQVTEEAER